MAFIQWQHGTVVCQVTELAVNKGKAIPVTGRGGL
jgi:hypothetical protein